MRRSGNKLIKSLIILIVALGVASASTYAWIANNNSAHIEGFNLELSSNPNLLISLSGDNGTFRSKISAAEIRDYLTQEYGAYFALTEATSLDGVNITDIDGSADVNYITIDLHFQSNVKQKISLKPDQLATFVASQRKEGAVGGNIEAWREISTVYGQEEVIEAGEKIYADAQNAIRVSFTGDSTVIWNPNPDKGFCNDTNYKSLTEFTTHNLAVDYLNEVYGKNLAAPETYYDNFSKNYADAENGNYIIDDTLLTLSYDADREFYTGTLTVRIWLEGWDGDCFDSITNDIITIALQFESVVTQ